MTSKVAQVFKLFEEQFTKIVFESRVFILITREQNFIDLTVRINEKFLSKPRGVIQNWKKGGESLSNIAPRYSYGGNRDIKKYFVRKVREKIDSKGFYLTYFVFIFWYKRNTFPNDPLENRCGRGNL